MASKTKKLEFEPDAWPRFERFVRDIAKAGPQHRKPHKPRSEMKLGKRSGKIKKSPREKSVKNG